MNRKCLGMTIAALACCGGLWAQNARSDLIRKIDQATANRTDLIQQKANLDRFLQVEKAYHTEYSQAIQPVQQAYDKYMAVWRQDVGGDERAEAARVAPNRDRAGGRFHSNPNGSALDRAESKLETYYNYAGFYGWYMVWGLSKNYAEAKDNLEGARTQFQQWVKGLDERIKREPELVIQQEPGLVNVGAGTPGSFRGLMATSTYVRAALSKIGAQIEQRNREIQGLQTQLDQLDRAPRTQPQPQTWTQPPPQPAPPRVAPPPVQTVIYQGQLNPQLRTFLETFIRNYAAQAQMSGEFTQFTASPMTMRISAGKVEVDPVRFSLVLSLNRNSDNRSSQGEGTFVVTFRVTAVKPDGTITGTMSNAVEARGRDFDNSRVNEQSTQTNDWRAVPVGGQFQVFVGTRPEPWYILQRVQ